MAKSTPKKTLQDEWKAHSEYMSDRNNKIDLLFSKLETDLTLQKKFYTSPEEVASKFKLKLNDEEIFAAKTLKNIPLANLKDRFKGNPFAFFDNNCGCGGVLTGKLGSGR